MDQQLWGREDLCARAWRCCAAL